MSGAEIGADAARKSSEREWSDERAEVAAQNPLKDLNWMLA